jgi:hypothetical protein
MRDRARIGIGWGHADAGAPGVLCADVQSRHRAVLTGRTKAHVRRCASARSSVPSVASHATNRLRARWRSQRRLESA